MTETTADILRRIAERERFVTVDLGGDTITLERPKADVYQDLLERAAETGGDNKKVGLSDALRLYAEILTAAVPGLDFEEAREIIVGVGIDSPLAKACLEILGTEAPDLDGASGKS